VSYAPVQLYYKNVMAEVIGPEHGITPEQWRRLAARVEPLIGVIEKEMLGEKRHPRITRTVYGSLPATTEIADAVMKLAEKLKDRCRNLVVFGIGGSALGNIAVQTALNPYMYNLDEKQRKGPRLFVFDNVDPVQLSSFFRWLGRDIEATVFNVISKSGRTAETAAQFLVVYKMLLDRYGPERLKQQLVITTGFETDKQNRHKSTLYNIAKDIDPDGTLLEVPDGIGGRFSVLSAVGLFSAAMCGIDIYGLLDGAKAMHERAVNPNFAENPAAINAAINYHYYRNGKKGSVIMPYCYALKDMADWYRQLWAESLGKAVDLDGNTINVGPTPIKALGTTDQHSQVQLYREGPNDKLFTFLQVENFDDDLTIGPAPKVAPELAYLCSRKMSTLLNSEKAATEYALLQDQRPCVTVLFDRLNAHSVGQFIYLFEATTSFVGALFDIDPYNQPAVELGKEATFALMGKTGPYKEGLSYEDFAQQIRAKTDIDQAFLV